MAQWNVNIPPRYVHFGCSTNQSTKAPFQNIESFMQQVSFNMSNVQNSLNFRPSNKQTKPKVCIFHWNYTNWYAADRWYSVCTIKEMAISKSKLTKTSTTSTRNPWHFSLVVENALKSIETSWLLGRITCRMKSATFISTSKKCLQCVLNLRFIFTSRWKLVVWKSRIELS